MSLTKKLFIGTLSTAAFFALLTNSIWAQVCGFFGVVWAIILGIHWGSEER